MAKTRSVLQLKFSMLVAESFQHIQWAHVAYFGVQFLQKKCLIHPENLLKVTNVSLFAHITPLQVVACYRHLSSCVGGNTDSLQLRHDLRQTREKAQTLSTSICHHLTFHLRDKSLPEEQRREMELLWVAFSSSLELLHVDMCKVFTISGIFSLADPASLVQTGLQGKPQSRGIVCVLIGAVGRISQNF